MPPHSLMATETQYNFYIKSFSIVIVYNLTGKDTRRAQFFKVQSSNQIILCLWNLSSYKHDCDIICLPSVPWDHRRSLMALCTGFLEQNTTEYHYYLCSCQISAVRSEVGEPDLLFHSLECRAWEVTMGMHSDSCSLRKIRILFIFVCLPAKITATSARFLHTIWFGLRGFYLAGFRWPFIDS